MFANAHNTNWAENYQFFLNQNNPTNFERVWRQAYYLYRSVGAITHQPVSFDQVMDFSVIEKLGKEKKYSSQTNEYKITLAPKAVTQIKAESDEILTNTVVIDFDPNSWDLGRTVPQGVGGMAIEELYDPIVVLRLEDIATLTGRFGAVRVVGGGATDRLTRGAGQP